MKKGIILLLFIVLVYNCYSLKKEKENSSILSPQKGWIIYPASGLLEIKMDSALHVGGDSVLCILEDNSSRITNIPLIFNINNSFYIPERLYKKKIKISINNRCKGLKNAILRMSLFNEEECLTDSIIMSVNTLEWESKNISFTPLQNIQSFNIEIEGIGDTVRTTKERGLWLDCINVTIDGIEITSKIESRRDTKEANIDNQYVIPIQKTVADPYKILTPILNNKVLSLGETLHGSATLAKCALAITEDQIRYNNCRLVIQELPIDEALYLNLYIQGKLPENAIDELEDRTRLLSGTTAIEEIIDFLKWLREYNETIVDKVKLSGFDIINPIILKGTYPLREYVVAHINHKTQNLLVPLFHLMSDGHASKETLEYVYSHSTSLAVFFGEEDFKLFKFCLEKQLMVEDMFYSSEIAKKRYDTNLRRDYYMWLNVKEILKAYDNDTNKIVLMGHNAHLNKSRNNDQTASNRSLGYYLSQHFGENYQAIALTVGKGERIAMSKGLIYEEVLPSAIDNSIEKIVEKINISSFFYPSNKLDNNVLFIRDMPMSSYKKNFIQSKILNKRIDGFIYIDESTSSSERIKMLTLPKDSLFSQIFKYQESKRAKIDFIIKEHEVKNK
jgi:erythromycin esterase-like protein